MIRQLTPLERFAIAAGSLAFVAVALQASLEATAAPRYADFIVGSVTWRAETKLQDLFAVPVFLVTLSLSLVLLARCVLGQKQRFGPEQSRTFSTQLIWWSLPSLAGVAGLAVASGVDPHLFALSAAGIGVLAVASSYPARRGAAPDFEATGLAAFGMLLIALIPLEIAMVLGRVADGVIALPAYERATKALAVLGMIGALILGVRSANPVSRVLPALLLAGQLGLPFLYFALFPAALQQPDGSLARYQTTWVLTLLVAALILWGFADIVRRHVKYASVDGQWASLLSPVALLALLVALRAGATIAPAIDPDDYHFGEYLLGWWSSLRGRIPYVDYFPAHGIVDDDLRGFVSVVFLDGSAGSIAEAGRVTFTLLAIPAFVSIYRSTGSVALAFVSIFFVDNAVALGAGFKWLFFIPFLCLWFSRSLMATPARWLGAWLITAPIVILGVPAQGMLLVTASAVLAAIIAWRLWREAARSWREIGGAVALLAILGLFTPFGAMLHGAIRYVMENGPINQVAYGVAWHLSWSTATRPGYLFEAIRIAWVAIPLACIVVIYRFARDWRAGERMPVAAFVVLAFALLMIPYAMGRIDPNGLSRTGIFSIFAWAVLLPLALWSVLSPASRIVLVAAVVAVSGALAVKPVQPLSGLSNSASARITTGPLKRGEAEGIPGIGLATVQGEHWNGLLKLNSLMRRLLTPGETYLDLTGRQAQYFYLDRAPAMSVAGPYMMVAPAQQRRAVEDLKRNPPRIALLKSNTFNLELDGGGLALRNPFLYRFILDAYAPRSEGGFIIGELRTSEPGRGSTVESGVLDLTDANWDRGFRRGQAGLILDDPALVPLLKIGDQVRIGGGEPRRIQQISMEGNSIWFDGAPVDPAAARLPVTVRVDLGAELMNDYRAALFHKAVARSELLKIPVAWGRSKQALESKMFPVKGFEGLAPTLTNLVADGDTYKVAANDPYLTFDLSSLRLSGRDAGLLKFDFSCANRTADPRIQIYWWGDRQRAASERLSIKFTADDGTLIVPLDADPRWLALEMVGGVRFDLDNASACSAFRLANIGFFQRSEIPASPPAVNAR
jgi:hypothetical protein